jgi:hypothetical protein
MTHVLPLQGRWPDFPVWLHPCAYFPCLNVDFDHWLTQHVKYQNVLMSVNPISPHASYRRD